MICKDCEELREVHGDYIICDIQQVRMGKKIKTCSFYRKRHIKNPPVVVCSYCGSLVSDDYMTFPDGKFGCFRTECMEQWEKEYKTILNDRI